MDAPFVVLAVADLAARSKQTPEDQYPIGQLGTDPV
jgi:hypothetical protein